MLTHPSLESMEDFFARIDAQHGGWPMDKPFLTMRHGEQRECVFTERYFWDEWNSTRYTRDQYLWWKISPDAKKKIEAEYRRQFVEQVRRMTLQPAPGVV